MGEGDGEKERGLLNMKIKCTALAEEMKVEVEQLLARAKTVLKPEMSTGKGKNTWFTPEGADLLRQAEEAPLTVAKRYPAKGVHPAANPRWFYCAVEGFHGKVAVAIPRKLQGKLQHKHFVVEAITDIKGTTFRHELLSR